MSLRHSVIGLALAAALVSAGCGSGGKQASLLELAKREGQLHCGVVVVREHGEECSSNRKAGVGRRLEQLEQEIAERCKTAPLSEAAQILRCKTPGKIEEYGHEVR